MTLFCDTALAGRIELAEAELMARASQAAHRRTGTAGFVIRIAGGVASFAETDSPLNKVAGLGFAGIPDAAALDEVEDAFRAKGAPVQVEVSNLGDPEIGAMLTGRGYRLVSFENVLGRPLSVEPEPTSGGIEVRRAREDELDVWLDVVVEGFSTPDRQGVASHEEFARDVVAGAERDLIAAGAVPYLALRDGELAGGALLRLNGSVAQFSGAATVPAHRRRGVQAALLSARLADAREAGCDVAVVTTQPGSTSQHNVQRRGFDLLYTRAVLVK